MGIVLCFKLLYGFMVLCLSVMSEGVRLRYAGIVNFTANIARLIVSLGFVVIVTRRLSVEEFGLWAIILALVNYPIMPISFWNYWCSRFVARRIPRSLGTGIAVTLSYLPLALLVYCLAAYAMYVFVIGWGLSTMLIFGVLLVVIIAFRNVFSGISQAYAPEVLGYGSLVYEFLRLPLAFLLVVLLCLRLDGALLTMVISHLMALMVMMFFLYRRGLRWDGIDLTLAKRWFKGFLIPLIGIVNGLILSSDRILLASLSGSEVPVAYMSAGYSLRNPIVYGRATASGLYAKMLRGGSASDVEEITRLYFAVTLFMLITILCLAYPLMSLLNPIYRDAYWIVLITGLFAFIQGVVGIFGPIVSGREEVDLKPDVAVKDFIKSRLFKWSSTSITMHVVSLVFGTILLLIFMPFNNIILLASAYPISWLISLCIFTPRFHRLAKSVVDFKFPWRDIMPFIIASLCSALCYLTLGSYSIIVESFWRDAPILLTHVIIAGITYLAVSYALSPWLRGFLKAAKKFVLTEVFRLEEAS